MKYIRPFKILKGVGLVYFKIFLPPSLLGVHPMFYVFIFKKDHEDDDYINCWDMVMLDKNLSSKDIPIVILDKYFHKLCNK